MKNYLAWILCSSFLIPAGYAGEPEPEGEAIELPLGEMCRQEMQEIDEKKSQTLLPDPNCNEDEKGAEISKNISQLMQAFDHGKLPASEENCKQILQMQKIVGDKPVTIQVEDQNKKKWKIKFYFGNNKTWYGKTTAKIKTSRLDLTIKDLRPYERRSDSYYQFWNAEKLENVMQWVDEPTNTFKFVVEHGKDEFSLSIFHPKMVYVEGDQEFNGHGHYNNNVHVKGTADGYAVDGRMPLKGKFGPDDQKAFIPGNVYFVSWENSHMLLQPELGYGRKVDLIKTKKTKTPIVTWTPSVSAGVFLGIQNNTYSAYDKRYEYDSHVHEKDMKVIGVTASVGNRLVVHNKKDTFGAFVEHKFTYGKQKYAFLDGEVKHDIKMSTINFGVTATVITLNKDKKPKGLSKEELAPTQDAYSEED